MFQREHRIGDFLQLGMLVFLDRELVVGLRGSPIHGLEVQSLAPTSFTQGTMSGKHLSFSCRSSGSMMIGKSSPVYLALRERT